MSKTNSDLLRKEILEKVREYYTLTFDNKKDFEPGDRVNYGGRYFDGDDMVSLVDSSLDFWLTSGRFASAFEKDFAKFMGVKHCSLTNSGSSANLLAFYALTSEKLGERRIKKGDEVITVAAGFPTTVTPIIQFGAVPVFVDVTIPEYNIDVSMLENALSAKTKAVMVAHTLGNPFNLNAIKDFCTRNNLWLVEDNCDALGSKYLIDGEWKYTGTIGDIGTSSFYPPHHMTMGEGGAVYTNSGELYRLVNSFRDWGRDCWCDPGRDNTCCHRFDMQFGELPLGYDHKYVYSHFGFNLKVTDMQAAIGVSQLKKLPEIINRRRENFKFLRDKLECVSDSLILPYEDDNTQPSWFGFLITVKDSSPFTRNELVQYIESNNIQTRNLFAGNLLRHPCFDEMRKTGEGFRSISDLKNTDKIMNDTFWIGVYPGLSKEMLSHVADVIIGFVKERR